MLANIDALSSSFEKDKHGEYIRLGQAAAVNAGLTEAFHPSMAITNHDLVPLAPIADQIQEENLIILKTGKAISTETWAWVNDGWLLTRGEKSRSDRGTILGSTVHIDAEMFHPHWYPLLDYDKKCLNMPHWDASMSACDMQMWRMILLGTPRQKIADTMCLSIKTIEKRITVFRGYYRGLQKADSTMPEVLEAAMSAYGITAFLLGHPDWFSTHTSYHKVQPF